MITKYLIAGLLLFSGGAMAQGDDAFFRELRSKKGKTFHGKVIYMPDTTKANDFWEKNLSFTISKVNGELRMPFIVGENTSRTWILRKTNSGLELKHDHRYADGKPDSISNYGGNSDPQIGTKYVQYFPADEFTAKLIPAAARNRWIMQFSPDKKKFYYILERDKVLRFKAEFEL
jgi:hypothetical protein